MTHLKAAVDKQRSFLIVQLIRAGVVDPGDSRIYSQSIAELLYDYEQYVQKKNKTFT